MAELLFPDIHEQILIRLGVKVITRFKCVSKSWHSLISSSRFIKNHVNRNNTYNKDKDDDDRRRRIFITPYTFRINSLTSTMRSDDEGLIVGSSNGLVYISRSNKLVLLVNFLMIQPHITSHYYVGDLVMIHPEMITRLYCSRKAKPKQVFEFYI